MLEPESVEFVSGSRQSITYYIPGERRVGKVIAFYKNQMIELMKILFECHGRDCGSSNYWANTVFQTPILYGPEQHQNYLVGRAVDEGEYTAIYIGQRGTRKIYVHIETTIPVTGSPKFNEVTISAALLSAHRYVIPLSDPQADIDPIIEAVAESIINNTEIRLTLVTHDNLQEGESVAQGQRRTLDFSEKIKSALKAMGIEEDRLSAYGVGPLSPLEDNIAPRLELLVIQRND